MNAESINDKNEQLATANLVKEVLSNYGIKTEKVTYVKGPSVSRYRVALSDSKQVRKIQKMESDLVMSLTAYGVRIVPPKRSNGKFVFIEIQNERPTTVTMQSIWDSPRWQDEENMVLPVALGRTIPSEEFMFDLNKIKNLLIAGACGTGKSVAVDAIINSLIQKLDPDQLKFVLMDPKNVEFTPYEKLSHLYLATMREHENESPIITTCQQAINILNSLMIECQQREDLLMEAGCRDIDDYNKKMSDSGSIVPHIVVIIDEFGDFIMQAGRKIETPICRLTQKGAYCGIHLIITTQRPAVNIITGVIKANFWTRMAFRTAGIIDSRTILDSKGAECLVGRGDMLYSQEDELIRVQCGYISKEEVEDFAKEVAIVYEGEEIEPYTLPYCELNI